MAYTLYIGNKNYSSWSLRAWVLMKAAGIEFREERIALYVPGAAERIGAVSPSGKVPCLLDDDVAVWDSLSIAEYLAERHPALWPADRTARAWARSITAEMHAGFAALRNEMGMNVRLRWPFGPPGGALAAEIDRVASIWRTTRERFGSGGPLLFGQFTIADAFYAPVAFRFQTYGVQVDERGAAYQQALLALPAMQEWAAAAALESERIPAFDRPEKAVP